MRDKLVEILYNGFYVSPKDDLNGVVQKAADHLIAYGVTVQKWIPVTDRLPEEAGEYNVMIKGAERATSLWYSRFRNGWYNFDDDYYEEPYDDVTHWQPLPEAPKEVE